MKISKKNLMAFVKNHAYGEEVLGKGTESFILYK